MCEGLVSEFFFQTKSECEWMGKQLSNLTFNESAMKGQNVFVFYAVTLMV